MSFFEWLDKNSPSDKPYSKEIARKYVDALDGKVRNPFQWHAVRFALETEFSKAVQKLDMNVTSPVKIVYERLSEEVSRPSVEGTTK
jgi:hypothetical protein